MKRYCEQCGKQANDDSEKYCSDCGATLPEIIKPSNNSQPQKHMKMIIGLLVVIIVLILMLIFISGAIDFRAEPTIQIESASTISNSDKFKVSLTDGDNIIKNQEIRITFKNDKNSYEYTGKTNGKGVASVEPSVKVGDYEVICEYEGNSKYSPASVTGEIKIKQAEPDYQSFHYSNSFEDTDKNRDGYVYLSDMNIAHTPKNIQKQMFADSDDDNDGKLNHDEYYKFMYKLNYDRHSYGM